MTRETDTPQDEAAIDSSKATAERQTDADLVRRTTKSQPPFVVGVGASAGGLEALQDFMSNVPADSGIAYVVVTHQHKGHTSMMAELLGKHAKIPVTEIDSSTELSPNQAYVGKPGIPMAILGGTLQLMPQDALAPKHMPIDYLFRSLAQDRGDRAIGIVLSGTGSDGSLGLKAIKGASGLTLAQSEESARYPAMPRSAVATGAVDLVLPACDMPAALLRLVDDATGRRSREQLSDAEFSDDLRRIIILLRHRTNHDFSNYKKSTIRRRIQRRMTLHGLDRIGDYVQFLQANQAEIDVLFRELLINVTSFFRDPEAFNVLAKRVLPEIVAGKGDDEFVRVWIPGCSTGEEAYSIAILLREAMDDVKRHVRVQIFATDLDVEAVDRARMGRYPEGIAHDVTKERLDRFFTFSDDHYKVNKDVREMVIFAQQNLLQDPPFTKLDLLSCRNLLIYLDSGLQVKRVLPLFHYSLRPGGVLFLGSSESVGSDNPLFKPVDKRWKMFRRNEVPVNTYTTGFSSAPSHHLDRTEGAARGAVAPASSNLPGSALGVADSVLLEELVPPTVVCNRQGEILHIHGSTGAFLELVPGPQKGNNLFTMAREGLRLDLASAVRQASGADEEVVHRGVQFSSGGDQLVTDIQVRRLHKPEPFEGLFLISFEHARPTSIEQHPDDAPDEPDHSRASELLRELQHTQEVHQGTVEELQTTNEELKSTNEELQSTNEELQSSNEELETSKEEMQSLNEELHTVNSELRMKLAELARVNDDMRNLLNGTDIATIFVDNDLCIKRYTEQVKSVANLIPGDVGRPLGDLVSKLAYPDLISHAEEVLKTLAFREVEVQGPEGTWFQVRLVPYRTTDNIIDGLVMTFVDITKIKRLLEKERTMALQLKSLPVAVFGNDVEMRYLWSGSAGILGHDPTTIVGKRDDEFLSNQNSLALQSLKGQALKERKSVREVVTLESNGSSGSYDFLAQPMVDSAGKVLGVAGVLSSKLEKEP